MRWLSYITWLLLIIIAEITLEFDDTTTYVFWFFYILACTYVTELIARIEPLEGNTLYDCWWAHTDDVILYDPMQDAFIRVLDSRSVHITVAGPCNFMADAKTTLRRMLVPREYIHKCIPLSDEVLTKYTKNDEIVGYVRTHKDSFAPSIPDRSMVLKVWTEFNTKNSNYDYHDLYDYRQ